MFERERERARACVSEKKFHPKIAQKIKEGAIGSALDRFL